MLSALVARHREEKVVGLLMEQAVAEKRSTVGVARPPTSSVTARGPARHIPTVVPWRLRNRSTAALVVVASLWPTLLVGEIIAAHIRTASGEVLNHSYLPRAVPQRRGRRPSRPGPPPGACSAMELPSISLASVTPSILVSNRSLGRACEQSPPCWGRWPSSPYWPPLSFICTAALAYAGVSHPTARRPGWLTATTGVEINAHRPPEQRWRIRRSGKSSGSTSEVRALPPGIRSFWSLSV